MQRSVSSCLVDQWYFYFTFRFIENMGDLGLKTQWPISTQSDQSVVKFDKIEKALGPKSCIQQAVSNSLTGQM